MCAQDVSHFISSSSSVLIFCKRYCAGELEFDKCGIKFFFFKFARLHILRVTADQELPPERDAPISNYTRWVGK